MKRIKPIPAIVAVIILIAITTGIILAIRGGTDGNGDGDGGGEKKNRSPIANAGLDMSVEPGGIVTFDGSLSSDPDGDKLTFSWDVDDSVDSGGDGIADNDLDLEGSNPSHIYPIVEETTTFRVVLNVTDGDGFDTDHVMVTIFISTSEEVPEVNMSCRYNKPPTPIPGLTSQYVVTIDSVSVVESYLNYSYQLTDPDGVILKEGTVVSLITASPNATIRYVDMDPLVQALSEGDSILVKDIPEVPEGSMIGIFYKSNEDPVGTVELSK